MKNTNNLLIAFVLTALALPASAGECKADNTSIKSAIAAKTKSATNDILICAVFNMLKSKKYGYIETDVQYAASGERFCMKEDEIITVEKITVKGFCK